MVVSMPRGGAELCQVWPKLARAAMSVQMHRCALARSYADYGFCAAKGSGTARIGQGPRSRRLRSERAGGRAHPVVGCPGTQHGRVGAPCGAWPAPLRNILFSTIPKPTTETEPALRPIVLLPDTCQGLDDDS